MKGNYARNLFVCEGCGHLGHGRPLPDGWLGRGTSLDGGLAYWCATCQQRGVMKTDLRRTQADAATVAVERARHRLRAAASEAPDA